MFIGRKRELESLEKLYSKDGFSMTVITGRRRIGKSTLIREFVQNKKTIFYTATKVGDRRNLELLSRQVLSVLAPEISNVEFHNIESLFDLITLKTGTDKLIFVLDELPYWAEKNEGLLSVLQKYIDNDWREKNLLIILCGSSLSFMEDKILSEKSPLFGRRDSQIHLKEFTYREAAQFVPNYTLEEKAIVYGVTGGVAKYLALFNPEKTLDENIETLFFQPDGYLLDEPHNLLVQEFTDIAIVNNIIEQIASGENTLNLIADKIHEKPNTVSYSIKRLISTGLVEKKLCITEEKNKKKTQYVLRDNMFKFWYEFIQKAVSVIEIGNGAYYYEKAVKPRLHDYMGPVFEEMCRYFTLEIGVTGEFGCFITSVGNWWGTEVMSDDNGRKYTQTADIDVVGISDSDKALVVGECKFKNEKTGKDVLDTLIRRSSSIPANYRISKYLLFSISGFTDWYRQERPKDVLLYTLEDLYGSRI